MDKTEQQQRAERRARLTLGLAPSAPLAAEEISVALKYALIDECEASSAYSPGQLDGLCAQWEWSNTTAEASVYRALKHCPTYRKRLGELVVEAHMSQPLAPELCIAPRPLAASQLRALLPGLHNHAVLFAATPLFTHEFYPLAVDAFSYDSERQGSAFFNVLGIHLDWIETTGYVHRVIALDFESNRLVEAALQHPLPIHSVHFICLGTNERTLHQRWSASLSMPQVNPAATATLSDDKCATARAWSAMGLEIPPLLTVESCDTGAVARFIAAHGEVVIKPNFATEGRDIAYLQDPEDFETYSRTIPPEQNTLLQARRDRVFFKDMQTQVVRTLALRLNVGSDGVHRRVDSGYAQLGAHARAPASRGIDGGTIVALAALQDGLVYQSGGHWQSLRLGEDFWCEAFARAERGAALFAELLLVGIDLIIDIDENGQPSALLIEANPRPAGLSHAHLLLDDQVREDQAGVGETMWKGLYAQLEQATALAV